MRIAVFNYATADDDAFAPSVLRGAQLADCSVTVVRDTNECDAAIVDGFGDHRTPPTLPLVRLDGEAVPTLIVRHAEGDLTAEINEGSEPWMWYTTFTSGFEEAVARWLSTCALDRLTVSERRRIEAVVREVLRLIDDAAFDREAPTEVAQARAAMEIADASLRAPRPSRKVLAWAMHQIPGFIVGALSNVPGSYLVELLHDLAR